MSQELEIEFKNMVSETDFKRLVDAFHLQVEDFQIQHNHYFDTENFLLKQAGCALRIREKNRTFELTLKEPAADGLLETNQEISQAEAKALLTSNAFPDGPVKKAISYVITDLAELKPFGTLSTKRAEVDYKGGLLVFDHSLYLGREDYEIEYEAVERKSGEEIFKDFLKSYQLPLKQADNKVRRFYNEKLRQSAGDQ
ncbi:CYTH domain-containing protein [Pseudobacillus wudalianchiensis]|uniref:CYTH domain-containing protein n=1 Tax=Pseudobacillus wudalianchiensis TaxID=1743143 RepID=A0A1B9AU09_9BACI|nr:CYTH domain-containing protein [Bacillus wudalianchiensis]OCA87353.1 CYTH domain-containing protein [Bacillus wudalianchiensis]